MKNTQRILSLLLALTLLFSLWSPAYALEGSGVSLSMTGSQSSVKVGEEVTVTIQTDKDFTTRGSGMTLYYDDGVLEPDLDGSTTAAPLQINTVTVGGKAALRISFLPGLEPAVFSASEALAQIRFKALAVTEQTSISIGAAYLYDELLTEIALERPAAFDLTIEPSEVYIPVTGIALDKTELTVEEGETKTLRARVEPAGASDPTVIWTSSDENVAVVSDGIVKGVASGTATVTAATAEGGYTAACTVTVTPPYAGYTVKMPADMTAVLGDTVQIPLVIGNVDGKTGYNAFDLNLTYDPSVLELVSTILPDAQMRVTDGQINILGCGKDRLADTIPAALEFRVLELRQTEVVLGDARVDNSGNALVRNASLATPIHNRTVITVTGYPVTLPENFTGETTAIPYTDYTFAEPTDYYDYTVTATAAGTQVPVTDNGDGTYTIGAAYVTGEIIVTAAKTGKIFQVTLPAEMRGEPTARHGMDYVATLDWDGSYRFRITVTIGGEEYTGFADSSTVVTIPGEEITGDIVFALSKTPITPVTPPEDPTTPTTPTKPTAPTTPTTPTKPTAPTTPTTPTKPTTPTTPTTPTAPTEQGTDIQTEVCSYVALDNAQIFLVTVQGEPGEGKVFSYGGAPMYFSEKYDCWVIPVMMKGELSIERARKCVAAVDGTKVVLEKTAYDVDQNGRTDLKDAQLVHDLYNAGYQLTDKDAKTFLNADVNMDKKLDVLDVAAVIYGIVQN